MILVPVKDFAAAKQRLASVLTPAQRHELAHAMLADVLRALASAVCAVAANGMKRAFEVAVVTRDPEAVALAREFDFGVIYDRANEGETAAIAAATRQAIAGGAGFTLVVPGDAPLVTSAEICQLLDAAPPAGTVLAPAADGEGTNAILRRPGDLFPLQFGNHSFAPHHRAAEATGKPVVVLSLPRVALDIDRPEDLAALAEATGQTEAQAMARLWGFGRGGHPPATAVNRSHATSSAE